MVVLALGGVLGAIVFQGVVSQQKGLQGLVELSGGLVVVPLDRGLFIRAVEALDLAVLPRVLMRVLPEGHGNSLCFGREPRRD